MKLNIKAAALACGSFWGVSVFLITAWWLVMGYTGGTLSKLGQVYIWYSVTWGGAVIGLVWGFVDGLICGMILAWLYNYFLARYSSSAAD